MSPEQLRGMPLTGQSDLFSLGTVLYEALTGQHALVERAEGKRDSLPPPLHEGKGQSGELTELLNAMLARDPALRPASAAEAGARFRTWLAQHHPQGVAAALGRRAERARARGAHEADETKPTPIATERGQDRRVTRTIATNRTFVELMASGTERMSRASDAGRAASVDHVGAARARASRLQRSLVGLSIAGALAGVAVLRALSSEQPSQAQGAMEGGTARATSRPAHAEATPHRAQQTPPIVDAAQAPAIETAQPAADHARRCAEPSTRADATSAAVPARAHVSVNARPWAEVQIDGRALGATPQRAVALTTGAHALQLDCPPLGRKARVPLKIVAGTDQNILVDLRTDPPRVTIR